ncbi:MAG: nitroreductase family protein [Bacteroidales bacterium]|nr:nitroreductase family protein [Bacteroidales bacterium]MDT8373397.1 nitroreductase family protein [Bacteroidales bacterium]
MEFTELINTRESIRSYDPSKPVPEETLRKILEAGRLALSAANRQPWRFLLISSPAMLEKVRGCYGREWFHDAPHVVAVVGMKDQAWVRSHDGYNAVETDAAIAMTHIILAAENEGVGACWIANYDPVKLREALDVTGDQEVFGITPLGYPRPDFRKSGIKKRKTPDEVGRIL